MSPGRRCASRASLTDLIATVAAERGHGAATHAVVGLPGVVDYAAGWLLWAPHLPQQCPEQPSRSRLTAHLGLPVGIANDADLAAVGETDFGAGERKTDIAYLTISTGIGAGMVHHGRLVCEDARWEKWGTRSSTYACSHAVPSKRTFVLYKVPQFATRMQSNPPPVGCMQD